MSGTASPAPARVSPTRRSLGSRGHDWDIDRDTSCRRRSRADGLRHRPGRRGRRARRRAARRDRRGARARARRRSRSRCDRFVAKGTLEQRRRRGGPRRGSRPPPTSRRPARPTSSSRRCSRASRSSTRSSASSTGSAGTARCSAPTPAPSRSPRSPRSPSGRRRSSGTHFFSPVPMMALCELVRGYKTSDETLAAARGVRRGGRQDLRRGQPRRRRLRHHPADLRAGDGGVRLVETGVASAEDIDTACRLGFGHAMGPLATTDLTGVDILRNASMNIYADTADEKFFPPESLSPDGRRRRPRPQVRPGLLHLRRLAAAARSASRPQSTPLPDVDHVSVISPPLRCGLVHRTRRRRSRQRDRLEAAQARVAGVTEVTGVTAWRQESCQVPARTVRNHESGWATTHGPSRV